MGRSISSYYGGTWNEDGISDHVDRYSTDYVASKGVGFLRSFEANDEQPWFVYLTPFAPHIPSQPEPRYAEASLNEWAGNPAVFEEDLSDKPPFASGGTTLTDGQEIRANQLRTLMSVDDLVAKVFAEMDALGETEQTLAVYMSDNGNLWGEHGMRGKTNMYEQSHHIPLFVRWPGPAGEGTIDPRLVANVDVAPTIMSSAGIASDAGHQMDGLSLSSPETHDHILLSSPEQGAVGIRTLGYQYVEYYTLDGKEMVWNEYYDFVADPWQLTDVLHDVDTSNDVDTTELHDRLSAEVTCKGIFC